MSKTGDKTVEEINKEREEIHEWQDIKELDAQIRTIKRPTEKRDNWIIKIGLFESMGEFGGFIYTEFYKFKPYFSQLKEDIKEYLLGMKDVFENKLTYLEAGQLNIIRNLNLNSSTNELLHKTSKGDVRGGDPAGNKKGDE